MINFFEWFKLKSEFFAENTFLIDPEISVSYADNFKSVRQLVNKLSDVQPGDAVVFIGSGSIKSYQLYFAVIAKQAIWFPFDFIFQMENLTNTMKQINPALIVYDKASFEDQLVLKSHSIELEDLFNRVEYPFEPQHEEGDRIISGYQTSGTTGVAKIVMHSWYATWYHADETVKRYELSPAKRLFNPRQLCHVSGAFPLTTFMHCGGSIVIVAKQSYLLAESLRIKAWAEQLFHSPKITHASFFPAEMHAYASFLEKNPKLRPLNLERITTGGEGLYFSDLLPMSRALAANRSSHDLLWWFYSFLGNGLSFTFLKAFYEFYYGRLVQITQTYGATELLCNAIANSPLSGPDPRGIGRVISSLHPEIIDENWTILPKDGQAIGRLRFFGSSIASGYLNQQSAHLRPNCYQTSDLASISPKGEIRLFGREEQLITLGGHKNKINPAVLEWEIHQKCGLKAFVFAHQNSLHAAIQLEASYQKQTVINSVKKVSLISSLSLWDGFPALNGGKTDRKGIEARVKNNEIAIVQLKVREERLTSRFCQIF